MGRGWLGSVPAWSAATRPVTATAPVSDVQQDSATGTGALRVGWQVYLTDLLERAGRRLVPRRSPSRWRGLGLAASISQGRNSQPWTVSPRRSRCGGLRSRPRRRRSQAGAGVCATVIARALHGAIEGVERQVLQRLREDELSRIYASLVPASRAGTATAIARWPLNDLAGSTLSPAFRECSDPAGWEHEAERHWDHTWSSCAPLCTRRTEPRSIPGCGEMVRTPPQVSTSQIRALRKSTCRYWAALRRNGDSCGDRKDLSWIFTAESCRSLLDCRSFHPTSTVLMP